MLPENDSATAACRLALEGLIPLLGRKRDRGAEIGEERHREKSLTGCKENNGELRKLSGQGERGMKEGVRQERLTADQRAPPAGTFCS